jgi:hypothetical protein
VTSEAPYGRLSGARHHARAEWAPLLGDDRLPGTSAATPGLARPLMRQEYERALPILRIEPTTDRLGRLLRNVCLSALNVALSLSVRRHDVCGPRGGRDRRHS